MCAASSTATQIYCCPISYVCNGWNEAFDDQTPTVNTGDWYCEKFDEQTYNTFLAPALIVLVCLCPVFYYLRKVKKSVPA